MIGSQHSKKNIQNNAASKKFYPIKNPIHAYHLDLRNYTQNFLIHFHFIECVLHKKSSDSYPKISGPAKLTKSISAPLDRKAARQLQSHWIRNKLQSQSLTKNNENTIFHDSLAKYRLLHIMRKQ